MTPVSASTLEAIAEIVRRYYLRVLTLEPAGPDRWTIQIKDRMDRLPTEVVCRDGQYVFQDAPPRRVPSWDREISNEKL